MHHLERTSFHITYTILSHKQTAVVPTIKEIIYQEAKFFSNCSKILLHKFKKGTAQIQEETAQFVQFPRLKKAGVGYLLICTWGQEYFFALSPTKL